MTIIPINIHIYETNSISELNKILANTFAFNKGCIDDQMPKIWYELVGTPFFDATTNKWCQMVQRVIRRN
jgi:hypothetical protein